MTNPHNVELEAAKFLHKLIQDSTDEPTKLATKLYVILQHMRSSGKENSMPYQVISRAMETVIKQHGLDIETLMSSRNPLAPPGAQLGESVSSQVAGSSQRTGVTKDPKANQAGNEMSKPDSYPSGMPLVGSSSCGHDAYQGSPSNMPGGAGKVHGMTPGAVSSYPAGETGVSVAMQFASPSYDNHGFAGKMNKEGMEAFPTAPSSMDPYANKNIAGRALDHEGGANLLPNSNKLNQVGFPSNVSETNMLRNAAPRDTGKAPFAQASVSGLPFKEHHLKQLRAQCLVFLAFRNGLMPKKLHLEIALGNFFPKEEGPRREMNDHKGKEQAVHESQNIPEISRAIAGLDNMRAIDKLPSGMSSSGIYSEANMSQGADNTPIAKEDKSSHQVVLYEHSDERRINLALRRKPETEMPKQERSELLASSVRGMHCESNSRGIPVSSREDDFGNNHQQSVISHPASFVKHMKPDVSNWPGNGRQLEASKVSAPAYGMAQESQNRKEVAASQSHSPADGSNFGHRHTDSHFPSLPLREQWKPISGVDGHNILLMPTKDADTMVRNVSPAQEPDMDDEDASAATDCPPSPKYTTLEKWILERQKRKLLVEKTWAMKQQKTEQKKIAVCSAKLKESVTSSEDINAKTKSVIELKKLKLLDLQRQLRSDILNDFFKPIAPEMDRLKSIKKHRIGRRSKQLERYEQKMKEERQKRIRERQKEFFSEVEVHRERLEDVFKMKRERWKGFNKYVREFHKRKERVHREKIDRIQREKINLLKINDVEGYLRMVQDAKSDRVKQLLKETEKYLQKLGSKLQKAKNVARRFETDVDDSRTSTMVEKNEIFYENEDETDQAKHYLESNEKYYMMAHSVKENVLEQPTMLLGGKLREYQMNGLRWLVSLYNNQLNGILADEMGLGKTVQVISLLCYLMENKNDRGPFLVVVPSSVLPGWEFEINFWAPSIQKIVYSGSPEERRRLFKEQIIHQKFNVLLTTYEYLMNKHDRPKLSKVQWHYIIIDEGHRIKNASCKLNADLKHYRSNHRLLLTGTPLQNNLEELWALLNFLLPNIFNSSEDFSQWFNKPFESNGDNSPDQALLSEEENLLIINRLHQVLRPFVLRRLKHKVENELPEKIERLIRCEASSYQKLLMKRVEENLGAIGSTKARSVHNSVMELRNICNHPYLSQLHVEEVHEWIPKHYLPNIVRLCGKLEMLDRLLPKLKATDHRVLLFSTMTRLLDVMEDYLFWKQYKYLRLDGHTSGGDRGALIDQFNHPGSPFFIFLLSIRAGGVGVNLQAADTVIIFDTDWNPQVDLQAQARAHRIGQKKDVLVIRLETVQTVEEQVRASAEHKLGVANQSITAGFFDNNTSAEDRREYLESLLRECKKEEAAPVLDDDSLNDIIARSESEIDIFESVDKKRREEEMGVWMKLVKGNGSGDSACLPPLPSRLLAEDDLRAFYEAMKISEAPPQAVPSNGGMKQKGDYLGALDTRQYGRGKRAREVRSYEEQLTEEEFERLCQVDSPESPQVKDEITEKKLSSVMNDTTMLIGETQAAQLPQLPPNPIVEPAMVHIKEVTPPSKRGRGRPRRTPTTTELSPSPGVHQFSSGVEQISAVPIVENLPLSQAVPAPDLLPACTPGNSISGTVQQIGVGTVPSTQPASLPPIAPGTQSASFPAVAPPFQPTTLPGSSMPVRGRGRGRKAQSGGEAPRRRGKRQSTAVVLAPLTPIGVSNSNFETKGEPPSNSSGVSNPDLVSQPSNVLVTTEKSNSISQISPVSSSTSVISNFGSREVQVVHQSMCPAPDSFSASLGSQEVPVPNQSTVPASDVLSCSLVATGRLNFSTMPAPAPVVTQDPIIMSAPCPNPVPSPAFPSIVPGAPSTSLAETAPKQGRGRGRKAQSGVEAPRRRGKRQNPEAPVIFEVSTDQDPKSVEVPEKKPRVNAGRRPTRRNKLEHDVLKQPNVLQPVVSQSNTDPAITQMSDGPEDEAGKSTNVGLLDASKNLANSVVETAFADKQDKAQKPTNGVQAGAYHSIETPVVQSNKVHDENEAQKHTDSIESNVSEDINCLPISQICDDKSGSKSQEQMNIVDSDLSKVLADSTDLEESKAERKHETQNPKELKQLDPSVVIKDSSFTSMPENSHEKEAQEQMQQNNAHILSDHINSDTPQTKPDPSFAEVQDVDQESESQKETDVKLDMNAVISESVPEFVNADNKESDAEVLNGLVESGTPPNTVDTSLGEVQDVEQKIEAQKETDVQSDMTAVISGSIAVSELAVDKGSDTDILKNVMESDAAKIVADPSVSEIRDVDLEIDAQNETDVELDTIAVIFESVPMVENKDNGGSDYHALNIVIEPSTPHSTGDPSASEVGNIDQENEAQKDTDVQSNRAAVISGTDLNVEQGVDNFKSESSNEDVDGFGEVKNSVEDIRLTLPTLSTPVSDILHGVIHDPVRNEELANKDAFPAAACLSTLPTEEHAVGVSNVGLGDFNNISVEEEITGEDGPKEVEQKDNFDGSKASELFNEGAAAPDPELLEESYCDETAAEKHENKENVPSQDSVSVLCTDENVAPVPEHFPCKLEDLHEKGDADDSDSKGTNFNEVLVLKKLTVTESSPEMSSPTLRTMERVIQQSDTMSKTENKTREEHTDHQECVDPSMESPVKNLEITAVSSVKADADADALSNENDLVSAHDLADSQTLGEITSSTCSTLKIEPLPGVSVTEEFQIREVELTSNVKQPFVPAPGDCEKVINSSSAVMDVVTESQQDIDERTSSTLQILSNNVAHDGVQEESVFQHSDDVTEVLENRNTELVSNAEATCEKETTVSNAETDEMRPIANDEKSAKELGVEENIPEGTAESLKVLEETTVPNAEINETRGSPNDREFENEVDMQLVEEDPAVDMCREVSVGAGKTISLKDTLPNMAGFGCDSGSDDLERTESSDHFLQKESFARVDVTSTQSSDEITLSSDLVPETENRNLDVPNAEVVEDGNADNAAGFCDNNTYCAGNLLETMDDSRRSFGEEASSTLQMANLDVAPADALGEKSEIMQSDYVAEVQGSKVVESENIVALDSEVHEAQPGVNAGSSQDKNGLQQLVEQYSDAATDMEVSVADSLTVDLRNDSQSSVDDSLKASQIHGTSALPAGVEACSCPTENEEEDMQQQ